MDVTTKTLSLQLTKLVSAGTPRKMPNPQTCIWDYCSVCQTDNAKAVCKIFHVEGKVQKDSDLILTLRHISTTTHRSRKIEHSQQYLKLSLSHWIKTVTCQSVSKFLRHRVNAALFCSYLRTGMILFRFQILPASCKQGLNLIGCLTT